MVKSKVGSRPNEFKYGMPLYGVAWPRGEYYLVCGGGGMGLVNRIVWARFKNGKCSDQIGDYKTGDDTAMRMTICPWGSSLLVGTAKGGIRRLQVGTERHNNKQLPRLVDVSGQQDPDPAAATPAKPVDNSAFQDSLKDLTAEVGAMTFNSRGNLLAVGFKAREVKQPNGEHQQLPGLITLLSYPSMRPSIQLTLDDPEVKDVDFCHVPVPQQQGQQQGFELLATVGGHGVCQVWKVQESGAQEVVRLELPKGIDGKAKFNRCRFTRSSRGSKIDPNNHDEVVLYAQINCRTPDKKVMCYLAKYGPPPEGIGANQQWRCLKVAVVHGLCLGSCMDISKYGEWIACGFSEGDLRVYDTQTLTEQKRAEASIAFVSSAVFNADDTAVIAVGGDANCYVMELATKSRRRGAFLIMLSIVVVVAAVVLHFMQHPEQLPYQLLQQLQQWSKQPDHPLTQACSTGSTWESFPLQQPVCGWVQKASRLLPDYGHDEL